MADFNKVLEPGDYKNGKIKMPAMKSTDVKDIVAYTKEEIEENDMPFTTDDINDMLDGIEDKMADLEAQLTYDNINDEDVPF